MTVLSVIENGLIVSDTVQVNSPANAVTVSDKVFQALRQLAFDTEGTDRLLQFFVQKGVEFVRVRNYVGLLALSDGTQLEILPKIDGGSDARSLLLTMLRQLRDSPFQTLNQGLTEATHLPLWEVFITAFLNELDVLFQSGIQRTYATVERNERFWKGKFQAARQLRENNHHAERLAVQYDVLTADVPPNRILKTALVYLKGRTATRANQRRIQQALWALDEVSTSDSIRNDLQALQRSTRLFRRYESALRWAEALLGGQGFGVKGGQGMNLSLLFPMERVFEEYVARAIQRYWSDSGLVTIQESSAHLVDEHVGAPKFKLRPDILIRQEGRTLVLDTKWKQIDGHVSGSDTGNYGIEQPDLYQLYAYGKKYEASDLFLIYPANETFRKPLSVFGYDTNTRLHVVPFNLANSPVNEVEKLAAYALSF